MTDRRNKKSESGRPAPDIAERQYVDASGIPRVALLPNGESDVSMGIPVSLDLAPLFGHMPDTFQADLTAALHAQGLIKPQDYFLPGASDRFRAAMLTVIRHDFSNVMALAKEEISHAR